MVARYNGILGSSLAVGLVSFIAVIIFPVHFAGSVVPGPAAASFLCVPLTLTVRDG